MSAIIEIEKLLELRNEQIPIVDVRSPKEFLQGHIPGAINMPLFDDKERALVGTCYKQRGREEAIELGLELVGPKMASFVKQAKKMAPQKELIIHCWRGGMRSASMAWLLNLSGFKTQVLHGGYKNYRKFVLSVFEQKLRLKVLGGRTGSGKTQILHAIKSNGKQIIDLEQMAQHKGSAFGNIGFSGQPSSEQFENNLADEVLKLDYSKDIWVEDESRSIGRCFIPLAFWQQLRLAPLYVLKTDDSFRISNLIKDYGSAPKDELNDAIKILERRLGNEKMNEALLQLESGNLEEVVRIVLRYYDKAYDYALTQKETQSISTIYASGLSPDLIIQKILQL